MPQNGFSEPMTAYPNPGLLELSSGVLVAAINACLLAFPFVYELTVFAFLQLTHRFGRDRNSGRRDGGRGRDDKDQYTKDRDVAERESGTLRTSR